MQWNVIQIYFLQKPLPFVLNLFKLFSHKIQLDSLLKILCFSINIKLLNIFKFSLSLILKLRLLYSAYTFTACPYLDFMLLIGPEFN